MAVGPGARPARRPRAGERRRSRALGRLVRLSGRFLLVWLIEATALLIVAQPLPEVRLVPSQFPAVLLSALLAALALAILNGLLRPVIIALALPVSVLTLGFATLFVSGFVFLLTAWLTPVLEVTDFWWALLAVLLLTIVNAILMSLVGIEDAEGFWAGLARWLSRRDRGRIEEEWPGRGIVLFEIDGLSHAMVTRAIDEGKMPTARQLLLDGSHELSPYDCGLPSQTSSCQAGIMYGDNWDIPAFRWYDKVQGKIVSSSNFADAAVMDAAHRSGRGLLRGGAGVNNHATGDADRLLFVMSAVIGEQEKGARRAAFPTFNRFFLDPYLFPRALMLSILDLCIEASQASWQRLSRRTPRIKRFHSLYPLTRAATNVLLRNLSTFIVVNEIVRGTPAVYTTYVGYDEIAHHAGPGREDALRSLKGLDRQLKRYLTVLDRWAARPYDLFILSDHGQSQGATFRQRYGETLGQLLERLVGADKPVHEVEATESARGHTRAFLAELHAARGRQGRTAQSLTHRLERLEPARAMAAPVIVCASGNLANVYFDVTEGRATIDQIAAAHPGVLEHILEHDGVGLVVARDGDGGAVALGRRGSRDLERGAVTGDDPLLPYLVGGDETETARRATQLRRLASFPHAGDLIVVSPVYPDGSVAAYEELVGSHGGLGGQQTEAFVIHPADMSIPPTENAEDLFSLLDARRGATAAE